MSFISFSLPIAQAAAFSAVLSKSAENSEDLCIFTAADSAFCLLTDFVCLCVCVTELLFVWRPEVSLGCHRLLEAY